MVWGGQLMAQPGQGGQGEEGQGQEELGGKDLRVEEGTILNKALKVCVCWIRVDQNYLCTSTIVYSPQHPVPRC
jgi:hypothetical protein